MNRAEMLWAQTIDALDGKSDGPEAAIVEGLRLIRCAKLWGTKVRAWYRSGVCTVAVHDEHVTVFGRGPDLMTAIERLGLHDAH